jgi:hypothetical protein
LIGTPQEKTFVDPSDVDPKNLPDVMDDFDVSCTYYVAPGLLPPFRFIPFGYRGGKLIAVLISDKGEGVKPADDPRNQRLVKQRIQTCQIDVGNPMSTSFPLTRS